MATESKKISRVCTLHQKDRNSTPVVEKPEEGFQHRRIQEFKVKSDENQAKMCTYLFTNFHQFLEIKFGVNALNCGKGFPSVSLLDTDVDQSLLQSSCSRA
jgi:hypothetical protein